jgi:probable rRNA maturation factor
MMRSRVRNRSPIMPHKIALAVQYTCGAVSHLPTRAQVRRWVQAAAMAPLQTTVRFIGEAEARALNSQFRSKDYVPNVLTFVYETAQSAPQVSGDIAICPRIVAREAKAQHKPVAEHYAHMVIHGVLHLQGFDHEKKRDAAIMESHERTALKRFRIVDPYVER